MRKLLCLIGFHAWMPHQGWQNTDDGHWGVDEYKCVNCGDYR